MKSTVVPTWRAVAISALAVALFTMIAAHAGNVVGQDQSKQQTPQISDGERKAIEKINTSTGADAKLKAAGEYVKKFTKSPMRLRVASYLVEEVARVQDQSQKATLAQNFTTIFNQPEEADLISPVLIDAYFNAKKFDQGVDESNKYLAKHPDDVPTMVQVVWVGAGQAQQQNLNPKLIEAASKASITAVELMEADKKPARLDDKAWADYRNAWLPKLYQARGVLLFHTNDKPGAKESLEKAAGLDPNDPSTLLLLITLANDEYQDLAKRFQSEKKQDLLTKALEKMDEVIDWLARGVAATEGNAQMAPTNQQLVENLKAYYTFRHDGKTDGMKELIEKYKKK